jgi:hypothetical protein
MTILSLSSLKYNTDKKTFNFYYPVLIYIRENLGKYTVERGEQMRLDLVMMSIYNDSESLENMDVILFINNIDNPLNINVGDVISYPPLESLQNYRYSFESDLSSGKNIRQSLATPNKSNKVDQNRKKFIDNGFSLPPVVLETSRPPVRLENGKILMGGLN